MGGARSRRGRSVPLSEHEQRILAEMEESLVRHDPAFAERVRARSLSNHAGTQCKWSALTFLAGLGILVAFYTQSVAVGLVGVAIMFASAVVFERNLRRLGKRRDGRGDRADIAIEQAFKGTRDWFRSHLLRRDRGPDR
jgi:hypothetical protein